MPFPSARARRGPVQVQRNGRGRAHARMRLSVLARARVCARARSCGSHNFGSACWSRPAGIARHGEVKDTRRHGTGARPDQLSLIPARRDRRRPAAGWEDSPAGPAAAELDSWQRHTQVVGHAVLYRGLGWCGTIFPRVVSPGATGERQGGYTARRGGRRGRWTGSVTTRSPSGATGRARHRGAVRARMAGGTRVSAGEVPKPSDAAGRRGPRARPVVSGVCSLFG